jgi:hypothetical protein
MMPLRDKKLSAKDFLLQFDKEIHQAIIDAANRYKDCEGAVMFQNVDMCSSELGRMQCLIVGPSNTFTGVDFCDGKWLNDLPSQRQYPQNWCDGAELRAHKI